MKTWKWTEPITWTEIDPDDAATWPPADADVLFVSERGVLRGCCLWHGPMCRMESGGRFSISYFSRWAPLPTGRVPEPTPQRPEVVCLCGSTRFKDAFVDANRRETLAGRIVLSVGLFAHAGDTITDADKLRLDDLHKRKIDLADRVLVLNVNGYIGSSTRGEIEYAARIGKPVEYLEPTQLEPTP